MKNLIRAAFVTMAMSTLFTTAAAHAQSVSGGGSVTLCIPLISCGNSGSSAANAPEISGSMLSTGVGLVTGVALMVRNRRRSSK